MTTPQHDTFTVERRYAASPARVYRALTNKDAKAAWFVGPHGWDELERTMDARPGGVERVVGRHPSGMVSAFHAVYMDLVPGERIIFAYNMHLDGQMISSSLATWNLLADGTGTRLVLTEQGTFVNGYVDNGSRLEGTNLLLDALGKALDGAPETVASRVLPCSRERILEAFSNVAQLEQWWGPEGFTSTSQAFDFKPGGDWNMTMHGPDGTAYPNLYTFVAIEPARIVVERPDPAHRFTVTVTLDEVPGGTFMTWCQRFDNAAHFAEVREVVEAVNPQLLARLDKLVTG
jgi:uncharacterized protein YndB with AHSA1/START domain